MSCVYDSAEKFRRYAERQPLRFIDRELFPFLVRRIRELSAFVGENDPSNLVILPNATTGNISSLNLSCVRQHHFRVAHGHHINWQEANQ